MPDTACLLCGQPTFSPNLQDRQMVVESPRGAVEGIADLTLEIYPRGV